ncbi:MAG: hypothetical protein NVS3B7_18200 [Candidatus Elarobacter sp.]
MCGAYDRFMETLYLCPDCACRHDEPAHAVLGFRVRCLDCQIEIDLALEMRDTPLPAVAA